MKPPRDEIKKLQEAFEALNSSTEKLTAAYESIQSEAESLRKGLAESGDFLRDILASLRCGVVVANDNGEIALANPEAARLGVDKPEFIARLNTPPSRAGSLETQLEGKQLEVTISPLNHGGQPAGHVFVIEDVTELSRLKRQESRNERLSALGRMAAGMAHEIRNPLGGMELFASILRRDLVDDPEKLKLLDHLGVGIQSINNVVSNFLLFTREPTPRRQWFDLAKLITDTLEFAGYAFRESGVSAIVSMPEGGLDVYADAGLLRQALLNLINNATQAMPEGGRITVTAGIHIVSAGDEQVRIVVEDTGPGIPAQARDRIFDPFFTTKESGAGLGLAIVSQIAQAHGGYVDMLEPERKGARILISFPRDRS
ncbi:MAG: hypothetical protein HY751_02685 [Nitrospinae bacterium]|nr:hypothetical protein [Nitrospinota bacterium]